MFTLEQLEVIDRSLQFGYTPEQIARQMGMSRSQLHHKLLKSGKQIEITRRLTNTGESISVEPMGEEAKDLQPA